MRWESSMDEYFRYYSIPKRERLTYCLDQLRGEARRWWYQEKYYVWYYKEPPIRTWGELKWIMREEYAPHSLKELKKNYYLPKESNRRDATPNLVQNANSKSVKHQGKNSVLNNFCELTSCKCKNREYSPKEVTRKKSTSTMGSRSEKLAAQVRSERKYSKKREQELSPTRTLGTIVQEEIPRAAATMSQSIHTRKGLGTKEEREVTSSCDPQENKKQEIVSASKNEKVQVTMSQSVYNDPMTVIMRLPFSVSAEEGTRAKGERLVTLVTPPRREEQCVGHKSDQSARRKDKIKENTPYQAKKTGSFGQVRLPSAQFISLDATAVLKSLLNIPEHEEPTCVKSQVDNNLTETSAKELDISSLSYLRESIMHLFLGQNVELISGTKGPRTKGFPPDKNLLLEQAISNREVAPFLTTTKPPKRRDVKSDLSRGVILPSLLKGAPPDSPHLNKPKSYQGKTLDSQKRMKVNLLSLGADCTISRSKSFQEGEYDADIKPQSTKDHGDNTNQQTKNASKNKSESTKDICSFHGEYQPNEEDLSVKQISSRNLTHLEHASKWNRFIQSSYEEDMHVSVRAISNLFGLDIRALIGDLRPKHEDLSYKRNISTILTNKWFTESWNQTKINIGLEVIQFLIRWYLDLPYLESHEFGQGQHYLWRPGEYLLPLDLHKDTSGRIWSHWIRRVHSFSLTHHDFPYLKSRASRNKYQRLYNDLVHIKGVNIGVISHGIIQKLSRYKSHEPSFLNQANGHVD